MLSCFFSSLYLEFQVRHFVSDNISQLTGFYYHFFWPASLQACYLKELKKQRKRAARIPNPSQEGAMPGYDEL